MQGLPAQEHVTAQDGEGKALQDCVVHKGTADTIRLVKSQHQGQSDVSVKTYAEEKKKTPDLASSLISHSRTKKIHDKNISPKAQAKTELSTRSAVR